MNESKKMAGLIGPALVVIALSEALNLRIWDNSIPSVTYLDGTLLFIGGFAIIRAHSRWILGWPVLITLVGWVALLGGLFRMFAPEVQRGLQNTPAAGIYSVDIVLLAVGIFLTFKAYWAQKG